MISESSAPRARRGLRAWALAAFAVLPITAALAATQYLYDDLGRLVLAANSDGSATVYAHDENGNVVLISQWAASGPFIGGFTPTNGHAGTTVTIVGQGFSATPANNTVTIGGVTATVSSANTTAIVSAIPVGANTGPITVTVDGITATSAQSITVNKPGITSLSPSVVAPGGSVTVTGAHLNRVSGGTSISVGGATVTVTSLTNNQAVFTAPSNNTGGPITVNTPYGQTTSATSLVIVPSAVGAANVVDHDPVEPNGSSQSLAVSQQNKVALLSFEASASSFYSVQLDALTLAPSGGSINYTVYGPTGASFVSGSVSSTARSIHLPQTTTVGRYLVAFNSGSKTSVQITARVELNSAVASDITVPASTTGAYQSKRFTFSANAGDDLGLAITNLVLTPNSPSWARIWIYRPNGSYIVGGNDCSTCSYNLMNLSETGVYRVIVEPLGQQTMSVNVTVSTDTTGALTFGTPLAVALDSPGEQALLSFTATAGQNVVLTKSSVSTTPSGKAVWMKVYNAAGSQIASSSSNTINLNSLSASTYQVLVSVVDGATGTLDVGVQ